MSATTLKSNSYLALSEQSDKALATLDKISGFNFSISELDRIVMPSTGETSFTIQTSESRDKIQYFEGIVVAQNDVRMYWKKESLKGLSSPVCFSNDCISGIGNPGGNCSSCFLAQFDSKRHSPNCQKRKAVLILREDNILPSLFVAPPISAKALSNYFLILASNRIRPAFAKTSFTLAQEKSASGVLFSKINAHVKSLLTEEEKQIAAVYSNKFNHLLNSQSCIY